MTRLTQLSASQAAALLSRREISAEELTRACLHRIADREPRVQAWQFLDEKIALAQARTIDHHPVGPLYGVPVGIKDIIDTADLPTEYGSSIYAGHRPASDAACVAALRRSGAVILGKTVTTEFAYFTPGKTRNPNRPEHTPGGSSSGSAAAVADHMVPVALGTQTAGSIIRPASFCGVIGFKPSFAQFPMNGIRPLAPSLDTLGLLTRDLGDLSLMWQVFVGESWSLPPADVAPKVGFCRTEQWPLASKETQGVMVEAAEALRNAGARIEEVELGGACTGLLDVQKVVMAFEMSQSLRTERELHRDRLGEHLRDILEVGAATPVERYRAVLERAAECRRHVNAIFARFDVLLTPSAVGEAPAGLESTGDPAFNRIWTLLHLPCISLPAGRGDRGLPVGIQLVGPARGDERLYQASGWALRALRAKG